MSDIDLTAAIEAGRLARRAAYFDGRTADECAQAAVIAAAPLIERAVREQVARDIEDQRDHDDYPNNEVASVAATAYSNAARIAWGDT